MKRKSFMVSIRVSGIDAATMERLRPQEGKVLVKWALTGTLLGAFVREDLSGAFLILRGVDVASVEALMKTLPMYPYMKLEIVELEAAPLVRSLMMGFMLMIGRMTRLLR